MIGFDCLLMASSTCAAQAAALGANVRCYEPTPFFVDAIRATASLNGPSFGARLKVTHARPTLDPCCCREGCADCR